MTGLWSLNLRPARYGLSARLLALTILFVMLAEILIYVPSIANYRRTFLRDRIAAAQIAVLVIEAAPMEGGLSESLEMRLLDGVGAQSIVVTRGESRRLVAVRTQPPETSRIADLRDPSWQDLIGDAFRTLLNPSREPLRVIGPAMGAADSIELILAEQPLRRAMIGFSINILLLSLLISAITAGLVFLALHLMIVRPVRRLSANVAAFADEPENERRIISPSNRGDEIGLAEQAVARMETALAQELGRNRRLADLGLAVSKVNHELRNMLATAQLLSDRLADSADAAVQRTAPRLMATLARAISFCEATLAYGRAGEPSPRRETVPLAPLVADLADIAAPHPSIAFRTDLPEGLVIDADPEQLGRILANLVRNAVQALTGSAVPSPAIVIEARREEQDIVIRVSDNGPGVPPKAREHLFEAFRGSIRPGGSGLGLAISAELARLHGGALALEETPSGAAFRLTLPQR